MHTGVKARGCEKSTPHESPSHSWKLIVPSVVSASKSGAVSPIVRAIVLLLLKGGLVLGSLLSSRVDVRTWSSDTGPRTPVLAVCMIWPAQSEDLGAFGGRIVAGSRAAVLRAGSDCAVALGVGVDLGPLTQVRRAEALRLLLADRVEAVRQPAVLGAVGAQQVAGAAAARLEMVLRAVVGLAQQRLELVLALKALDRGQQLVERRRVRGRDQLTLERRARPSCRAPGRRCAGRGARAPASRRGRSPGR